MNQTNCKQIQTTMDIYTGCKRLYELENKKVKALNEKYLMTNNDLIETQKELKQAQKERKTLSQGLAEQKKTKRKMNTEQEKLRKELQEERKKIKRMKAEVGNLHTERFLRFGVTADKVQRIPIDEMG